MIDLIIYFGILILGVIIARVKRLIRFTKSYGIFMIAFGAGYVLYDILIDCPFWYTNHAVETQYGVAYMNCAINWGGILIALFFFVVPGILLIRKHKRWIAQQ